MKKIHRVWALLLAVVMALSLITTAFAEPTIDPAKKASLSIYKYDITAAGNDGTWDAESYVSTGLHDGAVIDKLAKYAVQGVEFTYLRVADVAMNNEVVDGQLQVGVLYGFDNSDRSTAVLSAIGLTAQTLTRPTTASTTSPAICSTTSWLRLLRPMPPLSRMRWRPPSGAAAWL